LTLRGIAFGNQRFIAVGESGAVFSSNDGENWTELSSRTIRRLNAVTYTWDGFLAVGELGTILHSKTGEDWSLAQVPSFEDLFAVAANATTFVAVGKVGTVLHSDWTYQWSELKPFTDEWFVGAVSAKGTLVLATSQGGICESIDGKVWKWISAPGSNYGEGRLGLGYGKDRLVLGGGKDVGFDFVNSLAGELAVSAPSAWTDVPWTTIPLTAARIFAFAAGPPGIVGVGEAGEIIFSGDGLAWKRLFETPRGPYFSSIVSNGATSVATLRYAETEFGPHAPIYISTNSQSWHGVTNGITPGDWLESVAFGSGLWVATSRKQPDDLQPYLYTSTNGIDWRKRDTRGIVPKRVIFGGGIFLANGLISTNGLLWLRNESSPSIEDNLCYGHDGFLLLAPPGVFTSKDGITWAQRRIIQSPSEFLDSSKIPSLAYGNRMFVAYSGLVNRELGKIAISSDGLNWSLQVVDGKSYFTGCTFAGEFLILSSFDGKCFVSSDTRSWQTIDTRAIATKAIWDGTPMAYDGHFVLMALPQGILAAGSIEPLRPTLSVTLLSGQPQISVEQAKAAAIVERSADMVVWEPYFTNTAPKVTLPIALGVRRSEFFRARNR